MHMFYKYIIIFILVVLSSCNISKHSNDSSSQSKSADNTDSTPKLIFANFKITKDSTSEISSVNLTQIKITEGSLKKANLSENYTPSYQNQLRCMFEDDNGKNIYEIIIEHPLFRKFEYSKDDNTIGIKEVVLKEAVFSIRTDYSNEMEYVHIFEKLSPSEEKEITKLEIK